MTQSLTAMQMSRRRFIRNSALATVAAALSASALTTRTAQAAAGPLGLRALAAQVPAGDLEILNYALTLEHLEAKAYAVINSSGLLSGRVAEYFQTFGSHEATHVDTLVKTIRDLGGEPVQAQASYNFPALKSQQEVLEYFQVVEELGAAAYLAQAPRLVTADLITAAVSIHNVEGQHAAVLSDLIGKPAAPAFATPKSMEEVLAVVTPILMAPAAMPAAMPATGGGGAQPRSRGLSAL